MKRVQMRHEFVDYVPRDPDDGVVYVSIRYKTVVHLCACGCRTKIATPISPANWRLSYDGESISLNPSIGAWGLPCRSHYWIESNRALWSTQWTDEQIAAGRERDDRQRRDHLARRLESTASESTSAPAARTSWLRRLFRRLKSAGPR